MKNPKLLCSFFIVGIFIVVTDAASAIRNDWNYWGPNGEQSWDKKYHSCRGRFQSPVNIETERIVRVTDMKLSLMNYDRPMYHMRMVNTGHGITLHPSRRPGHRQCLASGSALNNDLYRFLQFHFHWRNAHSNGSEHAIDGQKYSMEMHLVHQNTKYDSEEYLLDRFLASDLFMVMAVFFNESDRHNSALDPIIDQMEQVINVHQNVVITQPVQLSRLLPSDDWLNQFYRYDGSYTTPDCQEVVTWIIFPRTLDIDSKQMNKYRELLFKVTHPTINGTERLMNTFGNELLGYYRHIQELGSRKIYAPIQSSTRPLSGNSFVAMVFILMILVIQ